MDVQSKTSSVASVQLTQSLQTVGAIDKRLAHAESDLEEIKDQLTAAELLSVELRRLDEQLHHLNTKVERMRGLVDNNHQKNAIYFDAYRSVE